jgi:signal transduction histidine kinase
MLILCLSAKGQDASVWLSADELETKGYYKNHGFSKTRVVIGLSLENEDSVFKERILKIHNPHINNIYLISSRNDTIYKTGDHLSFNTRPEYFWDFVLPVQSLGKSVDSFKLVLDNSGEPLFYNLELFSKTEFQRIRSNENFVFGAVLSFSVVFIIIFVLLGFFNKDKSRFIFAFFILSSTLWLFNMNGVLFQMIWPSNIFLQHGSRVIFSSLTIVSLIWYFGVFYQKQIDRYTKYIFTVFICFICLRSFFIISEPGYLDNQFFKSGSYFMSTFILLAGSLCFTFYVGWFLKIKELRLHTLCILIYFLFIIKVILKITGIDLSPFAPHDDYLASIVHFIIMTLFSIANIQEYRLNKKKKIYERIAEADLRKKIMSERIVEAQENERSAIAKNIHDQVGGMLAAMKIKLQTMKIRYQAGRDEDELIYLLDSCNNELYKIVDELTTPEFSQRDLSEIIQDRIKLISLATDIRICYEPEPLLIENNIAIKVYRIICELLTNSIKHSGCSTIVVQINNHEGSLIINYKDNGVGLKENPNEKGRGMENIKSRIEFLQGNLILMSKSGATKYTITIPTTENVKRPIDLYL